MISPIKQQVVRTNNLEPLCVIRSLYVIQAVAGVYKHATADRLLICPSGEVHFVFSGTGS